MEKNSIFSRPRLFPLFCFLFLLLFFITSTFAAGQSEDLTSLSLEELMKIEVRTVYSASKFEQKTTEAPSAVSIITSEEIKKYGYRTLAEILRSLRGFFITCDRNYHYLGVRGFGRPGDYNSRILLLIDGHRVNDNVYDGALIGNEFILDVDLIDQVEVIRGPASSLYGTNAFFGVINIITKKAKNLENFEVSGEAGSLSTYKGRVSFGQSLKKNLDVIFSASYYDSSGNSRLYFQEFDDPATNLGWAEKADSDRYSSFFSKISYQGWQLSGVHSSREKIIPTASYGTVFNSPQNKTTDEYSYVTISYLRDFTRDLGLMGRIYYNNYKYKGDYLYDRLNSRLPEDYILNKDFAWGSWWGVEGQLRKKIWERYQFFLGIDYRENLRQDQQNYDEFPYNQYLDDQRNSKIWGIYFQVEIPLRANLKFNAGVRYDHYDTFGGTTNPRLALIYEHNGSAIIKLLYGTAFRAPNVFESYYHDGNITSKANPNLQPEKIETFELVFEKFFKNTIKLTASGYYYKIKDLISQEIDSSDGLLFYKNTEEVQTLGFEMEIEGKWARLLEGRCSYSFQETENLTTKGILTNSPRHLLKFNLSFPLFADKVWLGIEEQFVDKRKSLAGREAASYWMTNLTLFSRKIIKNLEASLSIYNLFDEKYSDPGAAEHIQDLIAQDGRTFRCKLVYKF